MSERVQTKAGTLVRFILPDGKTIRPAIITSTGVDGFVNIIVFAEGEFDYEVWREAKGAYTFGVRNVPYDLSATIPGTWHTSL